MGIQSTIMDAITWYTGLSPTAFFTILVMMVMVYRTVCGMFVSPEDYNKPPIITAPSNLGLDGVNVDAPEPVQLGEMTEQELRTYNGSDPDKPILVSIRGQIYDVSAGRNFYGPGGPYAMFAGKECSRALALLSFKPEDMNGNLEGLSEEELVILDDWEYKFIEKYVKVGQLVPEQSNQQNERLGEITDKPVDECKGAE